MSNLRIVAKNFVDNSSFTTFPSSAVNTDVNNLKTTSRSKLFRTNVAGKDIEYVSEDPLNRQIAVSTNSEYFYTHNVITGILQRYSTPSENRLGGSTINVGNSANIGSSIDNFVFSQNGTGLYFNVGTSFQSHDLSTPWDLTTYNLAVSGSYIHGSSNVDISARYIYISSDGVNLVFVSGSKINNSIRIMMYSMSTPWDLNTMTTVGNTRVISGLLSGASTLRGMLMSDDGLHLYLKDGNSTIVQTDLAIAYDVESVTSIINSTFVIPFSNNREGLVNARNYPNTFYAFGQDGSHTFIFDTLTDISTGKVADKNEQIIRLVLKTLETTNAIVFGRHTFIEGTIIKVDYYNDTLFTSFLYSKTLVINADDVGSVLETWSSLLWGNQSWGGDTSEDEFSPEANYVFWLPFAIATQAVKISITTPNYIDVDINRLIIGKYIEPKYNISYGHSIIWKEDTKQFRTEGGTLRSDISIPYRSISFSLNTIDSADRTLLSDELTQIGLRKDFYISIFPESIDLDKKKDYSGIMKLTKVPRSTEFINNYYKSKYIMEEV